MKEKLKAIREEAVSKILESENLDKLNEIRVAYLGKKGQLTEVLKGMKDVAPEDRPKVGQMVNETRAAIEAVLEENKEKMEKAIRAEKLKKEAISDLQSEQQPETYKSRIEACREAILETGKAIFWQKCISRQPEKNDKEVNQMYEVQKKLYVYLDSLEDLKHYAEKKKRIDAEIEKAEEEHAREAALYAQQKKEDALQNAEMMGVIFGAEMEAYLLARDFAEEIKEDPWLYCALTDVDPWLVNIL